MSYGASRRRSEIGVRLALGAVPLDVLTMVLREGLLIAVIGMAIGVPLVWVGAKYVEQELYQMKALEPLSFALTLGLLSHRGARRRRRARSSARHAFNGSDIAPGIRRLHETGVMPRETPRPNLWIRSFTGRGTSWRRSDVLQQR